MKSLRVLPLLAALSVGLALPAQDAQAETFGVGLVLGEPTGLSAQYVISDRNALNFALGLEVLDNGPNDRLYLHLDYAFFITNLVSAAALDLPLYIGLGGFFIDNNNATVGVRVPFGVELQFKAAPINIFAELGLRMSIIDDVNLDIFGAIGARYYF